MATFVALLQGINLGAKRRVAMSALKESMLALGFTDVATYIQSGNVVFTSHATPASELAPLIRETIRSDFDLDVPVLIRTGDEMREISDANPYGAEEDLKRLHVTFLDHAPGADLMARLEDLAFPPYDYRVVGREIFVRHLNGVSRSSIDFARIARVLEIGHMTSRNWRTVTALADMARDRA